MKRRGVWQALLLLAALTALSCGPEPEETPLEAPGTATHAAQLRFRPIHRALVLSTSVQGEESSREALAAARAGVAVHVVTPDQWRAMTAEQFKDYRALILGDAACTADDPSALQAAIDTRHLWGPIVDGNIFVIASDPSTNHTPVLAERGVEFALARDAATGLYASLGCTYQGAAPETSVALLEPFGDFLVAGVDCHPAGHVFVMSPKELTSELYGSDDHLTGDQCAARTVFTHYPEETFATVALAVDTEGSMPGAQPYLDPFWDGSRGGIFVGSPYILARGASPRTPSSPPVARCQDRVLDADRTCGASGSIDAGSSDPDGDLVGCTQSPAGPYPLGTSTVTLTCTDSEQQSSSCTATVHVRDVTAPVLTLVGPGTLQAECGRSYTDPGATANDFCDGDLTHAITLSGNVDPGTPGDYGMTYDVEDSSGNRASARRTVRVSDTLPPVVTLHPPLNQTLECGTPYTDPGLTVIDQCFGDLTSTVIRTGGVDSNEPGTYVLTYSATDPVGNRSSPQSRIVSVVDTVPPAITVLGPLEDSFECGSTYVDPGATANDRCAGAAPVMAVRVGDPNQPGFFTITYSATDPSGNTVISPDMRHVTVTDNEPPVLTLLGPNPLVVECSSTPYADPGATAADQCFGDMTSRIVSTGSVETRVPGSYRVTYNVTDPAGNSAVPVNRTVHVRDTQPPSAITMVGPLNMAIECGTSWTDPGAVAYDVCAGSLPMEPITEPDTQQPGTYYIYYKATDPSGNSIVTRIPREVTVADTLPPVVTLNGPGSITIDQGTPWVDPGVTAHDGCDGEIPIVVEGYVNTDIPGTYLLRYSASDRSGNHGTAVRTVTVVEAAPGIVSRTSTPAR